MARVGTANKRVHAPAVGKPLPRRITVTRMDFYLDRDPDTREWLFDPGVRTAVGWRACIQEGDPGEGVVLRYLIVRVGEIGRERCTVIWQKPGYSHKSCRGPVFFVRSMADFYNIAVGCLTKIK